MAASLVGAERRPRLLDEPLGLPLVVDHAQGIGRLVEDDRVRQRRHVGAKFLEPRGVLDEEERVAVRGVEVGGGVKVQVHRLGGLVLLSRWIVGVVIVVV